MAHDDLPPLIRDLVYGIHYGLLDDEVGRAARQALAFGFTDDLVRSLIQGPVSKDHIDSAIAGPFRDPNLSDGELILGFDLKRRPVRIRIQALNAHCVTVGGSGSGKTTKTRWMVLQAAQHIGGLWLFDLRKREFSILRPYLARLGVELIVLPARLMRFNPLQLPTGVDPRVYAPQIADMLVRILGLPPRATKLLHVTIPTLYQSFGVFDGGSRYPILFDLREAVAADADSNPQARQAIVDSLDPVLMSIGPVLGYRRGWTTTDLARRHIVFEFGGVSETDKNLLLNSLLLSEFTSRVARGISNPKIDLLICCDEAARMVSASGSAGGLCDMIGLVRGTGIGLDLAVQSADLAPAILSNTALKCLGRCGAASDYDTIGAAIGLTAEQRRYLSATLRPGLFAGQVGEGNWRRPFLFTIPPMTFNGTDERAGDSAGIDKLLELSTDPA